MLRRATVGAELAGDLSMYCSQCGARSADDVRFCAACGAAMQSPGSPREGAPAATEPGKRVRPPLITVLAVMKFISGCIWLILGLALIAIPHPASEGPFASIFSVVFCGLGALALICGYGLWTLR